MIIKDSKYDVYYFVPNSPLIIPSNWLLSDGDEEGEALPESVLVRRAHAQEIVRYGGIELHNISALIGGIAAQEAVKVVTHQFVPLNNTYVYNGIACCGATYAL